MAVTTAGEPRATEQALPKRRRHRAPGQDRLPTKIIVYTFLTVGSIIFMAPFAWMVIASFKHIQDIFAWPPQWVPHNPTINNFTSTSCRPRTSPAGSSTRPSSR